MSSLLFRFHDLIGGVHVPIDDGIDKLNRKYTLLIFLFLALPIFTKQYMGEPIECFTPTYFTEAQSRYMNSHCWTSSTYYIVADESGDAAGEVLTKPQQPVMMEEFYYEGLDAASLGPDRLRRVRVGYYQWTALFLLVQGFCFHLPFIIWGSFANNAGVKLRRLLKRASDIAALPPGCQQREALLVEFVDQFSVLVTGKDTGGCCEDPTCRFPLLCRWANGPSRYLCVLYLVVKALYVVNVGLQFLLLTMFMGKGFLRHGFEVLHRLATDGEWWNSPRFPLQTLCRVRVEDELTLRTFIFRCVLPINVFNEKIYSTVWFYLAFLLPLNAFSLAIWIWRCFPWNRLAFVKLILWRTKMFGMSELSRVARKISFSHLGWDGVFILRMIEHNHGSSMTTLILGKIWEFYVAEMKAQEDATSGGGVNELVEPVTGASVAGPSTSWHSTCACHVPHFGTQHHHSHHSLPHTKRRSHPGVWENCL